jgi:hypothetical protein
VEIWRLIFQCCASYMKFSDGPSSLQQRRLFCYFENITPIGNLPLYNSLYCDNILHE